VKSTPEQMIAESQHLEREAASHRDLRAAGWNLTTQGGAAFFAERAGVKLQAPSLAELHRQVSGR